MTGYSVRDFGAPQRISSRMTLFHKRVLPIVWFGFLGVFVLVGLWAQPGPRSPGPLIFVPMVFMGVIAFLVMKKLIFDLVDEVWDAGSALVIKNGGREVRIELAEIINVSHSSFTNPPRVTLSLRHPGALGSEISFMPPTRFIPFARSPLIDDLIRRVDAARLRAAR
jgi:hypothetical protein